MSKLINIALRWMIRNFLSFALIIFLLVVGNEIKNHLQLRNLTASWDIGLSGLESNFKLEQIRYRDAYEAKFKKLKRTKDVLEKRRDEIKKQKDEVARKLEESPINMKLCFFRSFDRCSESIVINSRAEIEKNLLSQEEEFIGGLISSIDNRDRSITRKEEQRIKLNKSADKVVSTDNKFAACDREVKAKPFYKKTLDEHLTKGCQNELKAKKEARAKNLEEYKSFNEVSRQKTQLLAIEQKFKNVESNTLKELKAEIEKYRGEHESHIFSMISKKFENQFLTATLILIGAISTPIFIKLFFYYLVAPLAVRRPSITMLKISSGAIENLPKLESENSHGVTISELTTSISVNKNEELLIKDEYISDLAIEGDRKTRFLFSHAFPITSLAAGLYALTQIRTDSKEVVNIQATHESLYEVGVLNIPEGTALVLKPHKLIGLVQDKDHPIKITRHWRLGSLHAWLTLQLRYMVFHGPGKLILKGCKGIQVARADSGRAINQSATIGFTANVQYSNSRTETFFPYLNGKKELFNDSFHGDSGYYIYETMPYADQKGGLFGRGIEGLTDSVLKVFGI